MWIMRGLVRATDCVGDVSVKLSAHILSVRGETKHANDLRQQQTSKGSQASTKQTSFDKATLGDGARAI